jgi:hypothetical protein
LIIDLHGLLWSHCHLYSINMPIFRKKKSLKATDEQSHLLKIAKEAHVATDRFHADVPLNEVLVSSSDEQASRKTDDSLLNKYRKNGDLHKPRGTGRRPSVEERTMKDAYHAGLVDGGVVVISDDEAADVQGLSMSKLSKEESSSTQKVAQSSSPSSPEHAETSKTHVFNILCGQQDCTSRYFTRRFVGFQPADTKLLNINPSSRQSEFFNRSAIDPDANELWTVWKFTGTIPAHYHNFDLSDVDPQHIWFAYWPLMNAVIHGHILKETEFTGRVMNLLQDNVSHSVRPDLDTISHLFGEHRNCMPQVLQQFVVDRWIDASVHHSNVDPLLPELFVHAALKTALQRLSYNKRSSSISNCEYHTHATPESCYRRETVTGETETVDRQRDNQEQPLEDKAASEQSNSLKDVDRETLKADAHQTMRAQSELFWVGFRRFDKRPTESHASSSLEDSELLNRVIPLCPDIPEPHHKVVPPASSLFGIAQTSGDVEDVMVELPTCEPLPPSSLVLALGERRGEATVASREVLPAYTNESYVPLRNDSPTVIEQADGSYSLPLRVESTQSLPKDGWNIVLEMSLQTGKRVTCPGAFPESRPGSLRSVTAGQVSSLNAV